MNVLILSGKFGLGHYSAASAIKQELYDNNPNTNIFMVDILEYLLPKSNIIIYKSFNAIVSKWSNLYNFLNNFSGDYNSIPFENKTIDKINLLLKTYSPDIIISTLPIASNYISHYKTLTNSNIPLLTCITDISSQDEWIAKNTNIYFVPTKVIKESLINKGIESNIIYVVGIPVKSSFKSSINLYPSKNINNILIMGGGLGLIRLPEKVFESLEALPNIKVTIITGNNKTLYDNLKAKYKDFNVVPYTNDVSKYMEEADLLISKSGGVTLFESIHTITPLFIITPFLHQEIANAEFVDYHRIGKVLWDKNSDIVKELLTLIQNENEILEIQKNMKKLKDELSETTIYSVICKIENGGLIWVLEFQLKT